MKLREKVAPEEPLSTEEALRKQVESLTKENQNFKKTQKSRMVFSDDGPDEALRRRVEATTGGPFVTHADRKNSEKVREHRNRLARQIGVKQLDQAAAALGMAAASSMAPPAAPAPAPKPAAKAAPKPKVAVAKPASKPVAKPVTPPTADEAVGSVAEGDELPPA